jgi:hypothetical protein
MVHAHRTFRAAGMSLLIVCACAVLPASEGDGWHADYMAAVAQARAQSKLLFVVDVLGDFSEIDADPPEARVYRRLAAADPRVAELLEARFIVAFRRVGPSSAVQCVAPRKSGAEPAEEFAIAYICLPNERVLHFLPGFVTSAELLAELEWAEACNRQRLREPPVTQAWQVREQHLAAALPAQVAAYCKLHPTKWKDGFQAPAAQTPDDLAAAIRGAKQIRDSTLSARLDGNWRADSDRASLLRSLAAHGGLEPTTAHLVLAEFPLPKLAEIQRPLFEIISGSRYWAGTPRRDALLEWWEQSGRAGDFRLLVISDDLFHSVKRKRADELRWPPNNAAVQAELNDFAVERVELDELALLCADAGIEPIRFRVEEGPPRFLIYDSRGFRLAELPAHGGTIERLRQALHTVTNPGVLASTTDAGGAFTNERN